MVARKVHRRIGRLYVLPPNSISVVALYMYVDGTAAKSTPEQVDKNPD